MIGKHVMMKDCFHILMYRGAMIHFKIFFMIFIIKFNPE